MLQAATTRSQIPGIPDMLEKELPERRSTQGIQTHTPAVYYLSRFQARPFRITHSPAPEAQTSRSRNCGTILIRQCESVFCRALACWTWNNSTFRSKSLHTPGIE